MSAAETKNCQNCKANFTIEPEDFGFYEKISVPPPTWCPQCRFVRRMLWRNDWHLFKKKDENTGREIFSFLPPESPRKIYDRDYWISDAWDPLAYGREYDWNKPFFAQFEELLQVVPLPAHSMFNMTNCEYCTNANNCKNCYLVRGASYTEDSAYVIWDQESKQCFDSHMTTRCELGYWNVNTKNCYKTFFSVDCEDCHEVMFSKDCVGCTSCIGCFGLRGKSFHIFNQPYSKEEYMEKVKALNLGSAKALAEFKAQAQEFWATLPHKYIHGRQNIDVSGDYIYESKNTRDSYRVHRVEDSKFCQNILTGPVKDCYDYANYGDNVELVYESLIVGSGGANVRFSTQAFPSARNFEYCVFSNSSSDLFGCVGLRNKQYCILNKQYSKEEYEELVPKIRAQMAAMPYVDALGRTYGYGEFFPPDLAPFPYAVTAAQEFFPLTEAQAKERGYQYYPVAKQQYKVTMATDALPDHIGEVKDDILKEVVECGHQDKCGEECAGAFRMTKTELDFYRRMELPLPRLCPNCRHAERLKQRNPPKIVQRNCACAGGSSENGTYRNTAAHFHNADHCPNGFETSYAPGRPEIVYCEQCYNAEIL